MEAEKMGKKKKYNRSVYQSLAVITQFGINMLVPIFLCTFVGWYLDKWFHTAIWFVLLFFVGALAGFRNIFILAKKICCEIQPALRQGSIDFL